MDVMQKRFRLDHRHYHVMGDPEMSEMLEMLQMGLVSQATFVQSRVRNSLLEWLDQYPRDSWAVRHVVETKHELLLDSDYWLFTDDDCLATLFKLTWL